MPVISFYSLNAEKLADEYESLSSEDLHQSWRYLIPQRRGRALDVGAGSGRDAAWLAGLGFTVDAVEPAKGMRAEGEKRHPDAGIRWVDDRAPDLREVAAFDCQYDLILLSGMMGHIPKSQHGCLLKKLTRLLAPAGRLVITYGSGEKPEAGEIYSVSSQALCQLGQDLALSVEGHPSELSKPLSRETTVVFQLPDDGTGALPLLRHIIVNDAKESTNKLALLRALVRIADGCAGMSNRQDSQVILPAGLVALYWVRQYQQLIFGSDLLQRRKAQYGFAGEGFKQLGDDSALDWRIAASVKGEMAQLSVLTISIVVFRNFPDFEGIKTQQHTYILDQRRSGTSLTLKGLRHFLHTFCFDKPVLELPRL